MRRQEIEAKIKELQAQLDALPWRAEEGEDEGYWYVTDRVVGWTYDIRSTIDNFRFETGNYFRTKEEAQKEGKLRKFEQRVARRFKELGGGVFKYGEVNYVVRVNLDYQEVIADCWSVSYMHQRGWVAQNESIVKQVISEFDFLSYARGEVV